MRKLALLLLLLLCGCKTETHQPLTGTANNSSLTEEEKQEAAKVRSQTICGSPSKDWGGTPEIKVWTNPRSCVYHCPGAEWYGRTTQGAYMMQKEAQDAGFRPAYYHACK